MLRSLALIESTLGARESIPRNFDRISPDPYIYESRRSMRGSSFSGLRRLAISAILALALLFQGCLAPSYLRPSEPYNEREHSTPAIVFFVGYDLWALAQIYPAFYFSNEIDSVLSDFTLTLAMPLAFVGSIISFPILFTIALLDPEAGSLLHGSGINLSGDSDDETEIERPPPPPPVPEEPPSGPGLTEPDPDPRALEPEGSK